MKKYFLNTALAFLVVGGMALGNEPVVEKTEQEKKETQETPVEKPVVEAHVTARIGDRDFNKNHIYVYTKAPMKAVSFGTDKKQWYAMSGGKKEGDTYPFASPRLAEIKPGQKFTVFGMLADGGLFTDTLTIVEHQEEDSDGELSIDVAGVSTVTPEENFNSRNPIITMHEIWHGGPTLPPKTVARARVYYMAHTGANVHFGSAGSLQTNVGPLSEGWGSGHGTCTGNGPCYADEWEVGAHGSHHLRFYRGGTFSNGGGGGGGWFRGRRGR